MLVSEKSQDNGRREGEEGRGGDVSN